MIRFSCPTCQKSLKAPDEGVGRKTSCPRCGQRLQVPPLYQPRDTTVLGKPMPDSATSASEEAVSVQFGPGPDWLKDVASQPGFPPPAAVTPGQVVVVCPGCGRTIPLQPQDLGLTVNCARCNTNFTTVQPAPSPAYTGPAYAPVAYPEQPPVGPRLGGDPSSRLGVASLALAAVALFSSMCMFTPLPREAGEFFAFLVMFPPMCGFACGVAGVFVRGQKAMAIAGAVLNALLGMFWGVILLTVLHILERHFR